MPLKNLKPMTPGTRNAVRPSFEEITTRKPEKSLLEHLPNHAGRNNTGQVTARHRGGGHKQMYRKIDFKRNPAHHQLFNASDFRTGDAPLDHNLDPLRAALHGPLGRLTHGSAIGYPALHLVGDVSAYQAGVNLRLLNLYDI